MPGHELSPEEILLRLFIAAAAGTAIGWERETQRRPAGLRTHLVVAVGACTFVLLGVELHEHQVRLGEQPLWDLTRILSHVASGIGFLGAGAIIQSREHGVRGMTTAAGIWVCAAIGAAAGIGAYWILGTALGITLFALAVLRVVEVKLFGSTSDEQGSPPQDESD